jgi:nitrogen regulatory protein P-II 1
MKEIKAYVQKERIADVIDALKNSSVWGGVGGDTAHNLAVYLVRGLVAAADDEHRHYSMELGDEVVNEFKLELICLDAEVGELIRVIAAAARTGGPDAGWITVGDLEQAVRIQ